MDNTTAEKEWLNDLNEKTQAKADEISQILNCPIEPFIFVLTPGSDAAVGFFRKPDARQAFKLLRLIGENYESGMEIIARAQLVRDADLAAVGMNGQGSDPRFMDVNGNYDPEHSDLNFNLIKRASSLIMFFTDQFKKK